MMPWKRSINEAEVTPIVSTASGVCVRSYHRRTWQGSCIAALLRLSV